MAEVIEKWACERCGKLKEHYQSAVECCQPEPEHRFVCSECDEDFQSEAMAQGHINFLHPDPTGQPSQAELEAQGQQRIFD